MDYQEGQRLQGSDGKTYVVQGGVPREEIAPASGDPIVKAADPYKAQDQQNQNTAAADTAAMANRHIREFDATHGPGGKPMPPPLNAKEQAELAATQAKYANARASSIDTISRTLGQIDSLAKSAHNSGGWWQLGKTGEMTRQLGGMAYAGSDAANFDAALKPIVANTAFQNLMEMRQNSPTGGAVGNVSDKDMELLQSTIASLNTNQDYGSFMHNLAQTKDAYLRMLGKLDQGKAREALGHEGVWFVPSGKNGGYYYGKLPQAGQDHHAGQMPASVIRYDAHGNRVQ